MSNAWTKTPPEEQQGAWYWWRKNAQSDTEPCRVFCGKRVMLCGDGRLFHTNEGFLAEGEWKRLEEPTE